MTEWIDWLSQYAFEGGMGGLFVFSVLDSELFIFCAGVGALPLLLLRFFALRWWRQQSAID